MRMKVNRLATLALLSSLYVTPISAFDTVISTATVTPLQTGAPGNSGSILVTQTGSVVVNSGLDAAIEMNAANKSVENQGLLQQNGFFTALEVQGVGGTGSSFTNDSTGIVRNTSTLGVAVNINSPGLTFSNAGTIEQTLAGTGPTVFVTKDFNSFTNTGNIYALSVAIFVVPPALSVVTGDIHNSGLIQTTNGFYAYFTALAPNSGTFTNTGTISLLGTPPGPTPIPSGAVGLASNDFGVFENAFNGLILGDTLNTALVIAPQAAPFGGTFNNAGIIQADQANAVDLSQQFDLFNNMTSGVIKNLSSPVNATVYVSANNTIINDGFVNSGFILTANPLTDVAIDFGTKTGNQIKLFQDDGLISGDVLLASNGGDVLELNGGTIDGDVTAFAGKANIITLNAGKVTGTLQLGDQGDTVTLKDASMQQIIGGAGNDKFYLYGGDFTLIDGNGGADFMQIKGTEPVTFSSSSIVNNVQTIQVSAPLIANGTITDLDTLLQVDLNASMTVDGSITGKAATFTNNGTTFITADGQINLPLSTMVTSATGVLALGDKQQSFPGATDQFNLIVNNLTQQAGSNLVVNIQDLTHHGAIKVLNSAVLDNKSFITPVLNEISLVPIGTAFSTIISPTSSITDNGAVIINPFVIPYFKGVIEPTLPIGEAYDLVLYRRRTVFMPLNPIARSIAPTIDEIIQANGFGNPDFQFLIVQLDHITTFGELNDALVALSPDVSYGLVEASHIGMDRTFGLLWQRLEEIQHFREPWYGGHYKPGPLGYNAGDGNLCPYGIWVAPYGEWLNQGERDYNQGYRASAEGLAIGFDRTFTNGTVWGMAGSFTRAHVVGQTHEHNIQNVASLQGTIYGMWQPMDAIYTDFMFGIANNKFQTNRNIHIHDLSVVPYGSFYGWQYGGQFDVGYVDCESNFYIVPVGRVKATLLQLQSYTEHNAGALDLSIKQKKLTQVMAGAGLRLGQEVLGYPYAYLPEASVIYMYDFADQAQQTVANFIGGGTAFPTKGVKPPRSAVLIDLAVDMFEVESKANIITLRYECELRNKFVGQSGYVELYHRWF